MKSINKKVFAAVLLCAAIAVEAHSKDQTIPRHFVQDIEDNITSKITRSLLEHFDPSYKRVYLRLDGGWRQYDSKVTGFTRHPQTSELFGYGIGYRCQDYPMRLEFSIQKNNFKSAERALSFTSRTQILLINLYRDFSLPNALTDRLTITKKIIPYIFAGVGNTLQNQTVQSNTTTTSFGTKQVIDKLKSQSTTCWTLGIGISFYLTQRFAADISYRYINLGNINTDTKGNRYKMQGGQVSTSLTINL